MIKFPQKKYEIIYADPPWQYRDRDILCGCTLSSAMLDITPDHFCSYGERKEGAD